MELNPQFKSRGDSMPSWTSPYGVTHDLAELTLDSDDYLREHLGSWFRRIEAHRALFEGRLEEIEFKRRSVSTVPGERNIVFLTYENPWAKTGGVKAVADMQVEAYKQEGENAFRISPLHKGLKCSPNLAGIKPIAVCKVPFQGREYDTVVYKINDAGSPPKEWYLFGSEGFFNSDGGASGTDPYYHSRESKGEREGDDSVLARDSLFASKAVLYILSAMGIRKDIIVHAYDWQFCPVALTVKEALLDDYSDHPKKHSILQSAAVVMTMHNPYDHVLMPHKLSAITDRVGDHHWPPVSGDNRPTFLSRMVPLLDAPLVTVSRSFAEEMCSHPLQKLIYANHIQGILESQGIVGINNGIFMPLDSKYFSDLSIIEARGGNYQPILNEKLHARKNMLELFAQSESRGWIGKLKGSYNDGGLGGEVTQLKDNVPVYFMYGRMDLGQKGIDILVNAISKMPTGAARFVILSWAGEKDDCLNKHMHEVEKLAYEKKAGEILFIPQRLSQEFITILRGATYSVWPSVYEPFGSVTEPLLQGTPALSRLTGGLVTQTFKAMQDSSAMIGYCESAATSLNLEDQIKNLHYAQFPEERRSEPLFQAKSDALAFAMWQGQFIYHSQPDEYAKSLANLLDIPTKLPWKNNIAEYKKIYALAVGV